MGIKILEAEARAIDQLCETLFQKFDSDKELSSSEAAEKKKIIGDFVKVVLDNFEIVKEQPDLDLKSLIDIWHSKLGTGTAAWMKRNGSVTLSDNYILTTDPYLSTPDTFNIKYNSSTTGPVYYQIKNVDGTYSVSNNSTSSKVVQ